MTNRLAVHMVHAHRTEEIAHAVALAAGAAGTAEAATWTRAVITTAVTVPVTATSSARVQQAGRAPSAAPGYRAAKHHPCRTPRAAAE